MMINQSLYLIFFLIYPLGLSISYGFQLEILIFFLHMLYPVFVTLPMILHCFNILCIVYLTTETYHRQFFFRINQISRIILYEECIICYESKFRVIQFECCPYVKICSHCFQKIDRCPICKNNLFLLLT